MNEYPESKVLYFTNISRNVVENDLVDAIESIVQARPTIVIFLKGGGALVEMPSLDLARRIFERERSGIYVRGQPCHVSYSKSTELHKPPVSQRPPPPPAYAPPYPEQRGERILHVTVHDAKHAVTIDVLKKILDPYGAVLRMVLFEKGGFPQALVEFDRAEQAKYALQSLNGKDIYDGCNRLQMEYSRLERLEVRANTDKAMDFTTAAPSRDIPDRGDRDRYERPRYRSRSPPAQRGRPDYRPAYDGADRGRERQRSPIREPSAPRRRSPEPPPRQPYAGRYDEPRRSSDEDIYQSVLFVHNLPEVMRNCDKLFAIFSTYGKVERIRLLPKEGTALVQFINNGHAKCAQQNLDSTFAFGSNMRVELSKYDRIKTSKDDTPDKCKDYASSPLNRFKNPGVPDKNIFRPSNVLFFGNAPEAASAAAVFHMFASRGAPTPDRVKFFMVAQGSKLKQGLVGFSETKVAVEALVLSNLSYLDEEPIRLSFSGHNLGNEGEDVTHLKSADVVISVPEPAQQSEQQPSEQPVSADPLAYASEYQPMSDAKVEPTYTYKQEEPANLPLPYPVGLEFPADVTMPKSVV